MYYLPFTITSPKTEVHALQLAGGTRQIKTSWILIFLNYTWSMWWHFLSNFISWSLEEILYSNCCYDFLHRDLWKNIDEDKKSAYAYFDSLWFYMYYCGQNIPNVLKWIKAKRIFSRQYVFVPIVCWWVTFTTLCNNVMNYHIGIKFPPFFYCSGHWSLLVLCHFDEANCSDIKKGPRMIVLDSLKTADPTRFQSAIRKYASLSSPFWMSKKYFIYRYLILFCKGLWFKRKFLAWP